MTVTEMSSFPLAARDRSWNHEEAEAAIRKKTGAEDEPNAEYARCFFWHDTDAPEHYGSYKLLYCDVVDGKIEAVPHAIFAVAGILDGARGGLSVPEADQKKIKGVVEEWYEKMAHTFHDESLVAPWA
jgi:hypothetical protein